MDIDGPLSPDPLTNGPASEHDTPTAPLVKRSSRIDAAKKQQQAIEAAAASSRPTRAAAAAPTIDRPRRSTAARKTYAEVDSDVDDWEEGTNGKRRRRKQQADLVGSGDEDVIVVKPKRAKVEAPRNERIIRNALVKQYSQTVVAKRLAFLRSNRHLFHPLLDDSASTHFDKICSHAAGAPVPWKDLDQPKSVTGEMKDYQLKGLSFLVWLFENGANGILGDEMGLGKTLQTLSLLAYLKETGVSGPFLIICPLSVLSAWMTEIKRWTPTLTAFAFHGIVHERTRLKTILNEELYDIIVTSYEQYEAEETWFKHQFNWRYVVLDEGHRIKNDNSQLAQSLQTLNSQYRLMLTGTPLQNNLRELWALFHWLYPEVFTEHTAKRFSDSFDLTKGWYDEKMLDDSRKCLERIMLRRLKSVVSLDIPEKEEMTIYVPLSPMQRFWYSRLLLKMDAKSLDEIFPSASKLDELKALKDEEEKALKREDSMQIDMVETNGNGSLDPMRSHVEYAMKEGKSDWAKLMNLLLQLRKCSNHPYMLPKSEPEPFLPGDHLHLASGKMIVLDKLLTKCREGKHRVLLFSEFTSMLDILEDFMIYKGIGFCRLDGSTARPRRNLDICLFQKDDSPYEVFLISTKAGGLGINLTKADTVIFYDTNWNPQVDLQALARAHRIGQKKVVKVYRLISEGTVEEQMLTRIQKKLYLSEKVTADLHDPNSSDDSTNITMSKNQLMSVLRLGAKAVARDSTDFEDFMKTEIDEILEKSRAHQKSVDEGLEKREESKEEEKFVLEGMEAVRCAVWEGKKIDRTKSFTSIADEWKDLAQRERKARVVKIGTHAVLAETVGNAEWEAVATLAGKDPRLTERKRTKKKFDRQTIHAVGDVLPDLLLLGYGQQRMAYWIRCPECLEKFSEDPKLLKKVEQKVEKDWEKVVEKERTAEKAAADLVVMEDSPGEENVKVKVNVELPNGKEVKPERKMVEKQEEALTPWPDVLLVKVNEIMGRRGIGHQQVYEEVNEILPKSVAVDRRSWTAGGLAK
ncbi:hypothetical protein HK097_006842, partial [Rhizophlyctis rosea]